MRKSTATAIVFALLVTVSASAAQSDSSDRTFGPITRIIRFIKKLMPVHIFEEIQPSVPVPGQ